MQRISRSYLWNIFKTETGLSAVENLRRVPMEKGRHLLATTLLSVKRIIGNRRLRGYETLFLPPPPNIDSATTTHPLTPANRNHDK